MIIPITYGINSSSSSAYQFPPQLAKLGSNEVVLIEMQGSLLVDGDPSGQVAGKFKMVGNKKATLHIGHHMLEGEIQNIKKPIAVLYKKGGKYSDSDGKGGDVAEGSSKAIKRVEKAKDKEEDGEIAEDGDKEIREDIQPQPQSSKISSNTGEGEEPLSYEIVAIVEKKIVFNKRPVPVSARHDDGVEGGGSGGVGNNNSNNNNNNKRMNNGGGGGGKNKKRKK